MSIPFYIAFTSFFLLSIISNIFGHLGDEECFAPIYLFNIFARCALFFFIISLCLLTSSSLSSRSKSFVNIFLYAILNPFCIYTTVQGSIWKIQNLMKTPYCLHKMSKNLSILGWIAIVGCIAGFWSYLSFRKAKTYWRTRQFQRRWERIYRSGNSEEIEAFLYSERTSEAGLEAAEIEKLPVNEYSSSLQNNLKANHSETCPICFEDFKAGDSVTALPKCEHNFHQKCINSWLVKSPMCPLCRGNVKNNLGVKTKTWNFADLIDPKHSVLFFIIFLVIIL